MGVLSATLSFRFGAARYISILAWDDEKKRALNSNSVAEIYMTDFHAQYNLVFGTVAQGLYSDLAFWNFSFFATTAGAGAL